MAMQLAEVLGLEVGRVAANDEGVPVLEVGVGLLLVLLRIGRDHDRLPADLRQVARPQPRPLRAHEIARHEVAAHQSDTPAHRSDCLWCSRR